MKLHYALSPSRAYRATLLASEFENWEIYIPPSSPYFPRWEKLYLSVINDSVHNVLHRPTTWPRLESGKLSRIINHSETAAHVLRVPCTINTSLFSSERTSFSLTEKRFNIGFIAIQGTINVYEFENSASDSFDDECFVWKRLRRFIFL